MWLVLLLHARPVPQVRRVAGVRSRRDARLAPGRAGGAGARAAGEPHAAAGAGRDVRRRSAVRGRRDGNGIPRGRFGRRAARRHGRGAWARARGVMRRTGCARVGRRTGDRRRLGRRAPLGRAGVRRPCGSPHRGGSARGGEGGDGGRGADIVVDAVGHPDVLDTACRMARKAGTVRWSVSTRSGARCTWAWCGSRRSRFAPGTRT